MGTRPAKTLVMLATYNEIDNLPDLVSEIFYTSPHVDVLVIDDNSPDGTGQWCDTQAATNLRVHCLHREGKSGLGSAIIAGMQYAIDHGFELVLNLDADFSHRPRYIPDLLDGMNRGEQPASDVMIGSRYVPGGGIEGWPLRRHLMSRCVNLYARWMLSLKPRDCSGAFRCYRTEILKKVQWDAVRSRGYSFQEEILWILRRAGARIGETPILFVDRQRGKSKINGREAISALWIIFRLGVKNWLGV